MANVIIRLGYKDSAWFTANPNFLLEEGQTVHLAQTGTYKIGDGTTVLSGLSFLGGVVLPYTAGTGLQLTGQQFSIDSTVATLSGSQAFTNKTGAISMWTNDSGYITIAALSPYLTSATAASTYEPIITGSTTLKYWRGDKTFQTLDTSAVPENGNLYFTTARVLATALAGLSVTGSSIASSDTVIQAFGKLQNQINGVLGGAIYQGTWNASTNSPTLTSSIGTKGYYYVVSVAGSTNLDGTTDWKVGDWAIFNGTTWDKVDNTDAVSSVNSAIGAVSLTGTANRITVTGTTWDIASTYVGQTSITTLGTITTGTWNGTAIGSAYIASMTSAQLAGIISDETGSGALVFGTSPTFTTGITVSTSTAGQGATIGNAFVGVWNGSNNYAALYHTSMNATTQYGFIMDNAGFNYLNAGTQISASIATNPVWTVTDRKLNVNPVAFTSGSTIHFTYTVPNDTGLTASTNIPNFKIIGGTKTFAAGTLATQYFNYFTDNTIAFASASTATDSYNTYIESVVAGANVTALTRKYSLGTSDNVAFGISNSTASLWLGVAPSSSNFALSVAAGAGSMYLNAPTNGFLVLSVGTGNKIQVNKSSMTFTGSAATGGSTPMFTFTNPNNGARTASTEVFGFSYVAGTQLWNVGTLALQREVNLATPTYSFLSASTLTLAANLGVNYVQGGTNSTITTSSAIYIPTLALTNTTTAYGINVEAASGATNKFAALFNTGGSTMKIGAYNNSATEVAIWFQQSSPSTSNFGIYGSATTTQLNATNQVYITAGAANMNLVPGAFTVGSSGGRVDIAPGNSAGFAICQSASQKLGFWNATPIVQPASANQAAVTTTVATTASTNVAPYGYTTQAQADDLVTEVGQLKVLCNQLRSDLVSAGLIKGAA